MYFKSHKYVRAPTHFFVHHPSNQPTEPYILYIMYQMGH